MLNKDLLLIDNNMVQSLGSIDPLDRGDDEWFRALDGSWFTGYGFKVPVLHHVGSIIYKNMSFDVPNDVQNGIKINFAIKNESLLPLEPENIYEYSEITYDIPAEVHFKLKFGLTIDSVVRDVHFSQIFRPGLSSSWVNYTIQLLPKDAWIPDLETTLEDKTVTTSQLWQIRIDIQPQFKEWHKSGFVNPRTIALLNNERWWEKNVPVWHIGDEKTWCSQSSRIYIDALRLSHY